MDISDIRKLNLAKLINERYNGKTGLFADAMGKHRSYVSSLLSPTGGRSLGTKVAREFEVKMNLPRGLLDSQNHINNDDIQFEPIENDDIEKVNTEGYQHLAKLEFMDMNGKKIPNASIETSLSFNADFFSARRINSTSAGLIKIVDDSMIDRINQGDIVIVDYTKTTITSGKIYVATFLNDCYIRRILKKPDGGIIIRSDNLNKNRYPDIEIPADKIEQLKIIGQAIEILSGPIH